LAGRDPDGWVGGRSARLSRASRRRSREGLTRAAGRTMIVGNCLRAYLL